MLRYEKKRKTCEVNESLKNTYNTIMEVPAASAPPFLPGKEYPFGGCQNIDWLRACLKNHSCNLHAPLCGIFHPNSVAVARYAPHPGEISHKIVTHILQKAFFKHALEKESGSIG